jgi:predicted nucleic acid-binding protein
MSRIFWDSMLFVYLFDGNPQHSPRTEHLLQRSFERGDSLFTSYLALGEAIAGAAKSPDPTRYLTIRPTLDEMGFSFLAFGESAVGPFGRLRSETRLKVPDSIHLACAASAGIDLFLTGDKQLVGLHVPGIQFIADFNTNIL